MKTRFILNPCSGKNRRRPWPCHPPGFCSDEPLDALIVFTERPGHATELAREALADGCERIVAWAGTHSQRDARRSSAPLPLSPSCLAPAMGWRFILGLPTQPRRALALLADPTARVVAIDTGIAEGHPSSMPWPRFDAEISRRSTPARRGSPRTRTPC